ncbi:hypothetical protein [Kineosporia sp. NBRC 101677]|uniref:hypothetical protein n=1 Tax=Kineosporia sp. NBRC 101677 TaxID=3032197 RepID=UPI0025530694|nr:hypothetical protein [Kineosporia sp. NBRC 101677]
MPIANQHNVFSSYGAVHMQRQLIPSSVLHSSELSSAAEQAAASMAAKDSVHQAHSVGATSTENRTHGFDKHAAKGSSFAMGAGGAGGSGTAEPDTGSAGGAPEQARQELPLGATLDVFL